MKTLQQFKDYYYDTLQPRLAGMEEKRKKAVFKFVVQLSIFF